MVSFYLTSDIELEGQWEFSHENLKTLTLAHDLDELQEDAYFRTLIFKPIAEGEDIIAFNLTNGIKHEYVVTVSKDEAGIFRIKIAKTN